MDNLDQKEAKWQQMLAKSYKDYLITVACCCVGWFILNWGMQAAGDGYGSDGVTLLGYLIMGGPVFLGMLRGGVGSLFFWRGYEVITTYSDGSKRSDGGYESAATGLVARLFLLIICLIIGGIVTAIKVFWLTAKSITCYLKVQHKPGFVRSPFLVLIAGFVSLILFAVIPSSVGNIRRHAPVDSTVISIDPQQGVTTQNNIYVYDRPQGKVSEALGTLNKGDLVTVIGKEIKGHRNSMWIPINYNGKTGWVYTWAIQVK